MKTFLTLFALLIVVPLNSSAQQKVVSIQEGPSKQQMEQFYSQTRFPFWASKKILSGARSGYRNEDIHGSIEAFPKNQMQGLNVFVWEDLQCTKNQRFKQLAGWLILNKSLSNQRTLKDIEIFAAGVLQRHILAIYDANGVLIDQLESAVFGESAKDGLPLWIKQFCVDPDMTVTIYELKADPKVPLNFWDQFESLSARRLDTKYKIDDTGHFKKISEVSYQPQTYTITQLTDPSKNIWDGMETVVK